MKISHDSEGRRFRQSVEADGCFGLRTMRRFHQDEEGAILLFSLAGILVLMLLTWTVMDVGQVTRTKLESQASADMAAYSQAAVKARSMNMLAYTNIAKRSIVGIHSLYAGMFFAYEEWLLTEMWDACGANPGDTATCAALARELDQWRQERDNDYKKFESNTKGVYQEDLKALDNYQNYIMNLTPWWGWSEAVVRAQRNTATFAASYPPPGGSIRKNFPDITDAVIAKVGSVGHNNLSSAVESLPVKHSGDRVAWGQGPDSGGITDPAYIKERADYASLHQSNSALGAALDQNIADGQKYASYNVGNSIEALGQWARPVVFQEWLDTDEKWLRATSNIIFTFHDGGELFEARREKYSVPASEYDLDAIGASDDVFRPKGYWAMARSEISFVPAGRVKVPDMWHARWTARMRPVALPDELVYGGYNLNAVYYDIMPFLTLSLQMTSKGAHHADEYFHDMVWMERATRGMGNSTIDGVGK